MTRSHLALSVKRSQTLSKKEAVSLKSLILFLVVVVVRTSVCACLLPSASHARARTTKQDVQPVRKLTTAQTIGHANKSRSTRAQEHPRAPVY